MRNSERGVTLIGWLVLLAPLAIVIYSAIRLTPIYMNYLSVSRVLEQLKSETPAGSPVNPQAVKISLEKRLDIEGITVPTFKDIEIKRDGDNWVAIADYEEVAPLFFNVSLLVQFHKQASL